MVIIMAVKNSPRESIHVFFDGPLLRLSLLTWGERQGACEEARLVDGIREKRASDEEAILCAPLFHGGRKEIQRGLPEGCSRESREVRLARGILRYRPFDYAPNVENDPSLKRNVARAIKEVCVRILRESDVMIAVADGDDTGVAFEAGVADTSLIPIVLITDKTDVGKANAMLLGSAAAVVDQIMKPGRIDFMLDIVLGLSVLERR